MSLLTAERIKLFSTRSPWWCALAAAALPIGFASLLALRSGPELPLDVQVTQATAGLGRSVVMVLAALAITTEYRFGTIRGTFQAAPSRTPVLLAKTAVVTALCAVIGAVVGFGAWGVCRVIRPEADIALDTADEFRAVAGQAAVYAITAALALGIGILVRQTAGAVALLLVYALLVENLITLIPGVGDDIRDWMPFFAAERFITGSAPDLPLGPWGYLAYFAAVAAVSLGAGLVAAKRRDA